MASLADLVRSMNCYYSNLIEGHDTHLVGIERALKGDYSKDAKMRDLQLEAQAHITDRQWFDAERTETHTLTAQFICDIHRRFYELVPEDLMWTEDQVTHERIKIIPGEIRHSDVVVGNHIAISPLLAARGVACRHIDPGSPWQNGKNERFNGTLRSECTELETFHHRDHARAVCGLFTRHYNTERPHWSLGYQTPEEFAQRHSAAPAAPRNAAASS